MDESGITVTHDPLKNLYALRDHLAAHDKPIVLFLGAGTSCSVRIMRDEKESGSAEEQALIPAAEELTRHCARAVGGLGDVFKAAWSAVEEECGATGQAPNVENVLTRVRMKIEAIGGADTLVGLSGTQLREMENAITATIGELANPPEEDIPAATPHRDLARWVGRMPRKQPVEVFTTNYDVLIERAMEMEECLFFDGFVGSVRPFFSSADDSPTYWTRLWKVHGSVNWALETDSGRQRITRVAPNSSGQMILPSHRKYDEARKQPYIALLDRLGHCISQEDAIVVTVGFSFRDDHINNVIFENLERSRRSQVFALMFDEPAASDGVVRTATQQPKLSVLGPSSAVIGGNIGTWRLVEPVDDRTAPFMDIAFDSDAVPEGDVAAVTGRMKLGDFNRFCRFLSTMEV